MVDPALDPQAQLVAIAGAFALPAPVASVEPLGNGNVNATYLVELAGDEPQRYVLQKLNTQVFAQPQSLMANLTEVSAHVTRRLAQLPDAPDAGRSWEMPAVMPAASGDQTWVETDDGFWRLISFIDDTFCLDTLTSVDQARELGYGLGRFHALISDLPPELLADTLPGFHVTPTYLQAYDGVLTGSDRANEPAIGDCLEFVAARRSFVAVLEDALAAGVLRPRPIHGDPKVNNVLLDRSSGRAIALVDLDTVKPGLVHYDIGDCLRSGCNRLGEETKDLDQVGFDLDFCGAILAGYGAAARHVLSDADLDYLYDAIRLISFELGLRFLSDYLAGDVYFRVEHPQQNLRRAQVQFRLTEDIEAKEDAIRAIIERLR
jgi:Ser/Thr protein kinase RdoA (MazF antagonist)